LSALLLLSSPVATLASAFGSLFSKHSKFPSHELKMLLTRQSKNVKTEFYCTHKKQILKKASVNHYSLAYSLKPANLYHYRIKVSYSLNDSISLTLSSLDRVVYK